MFEASAPTPARKAIATRATDRDRRVATPGHLIDDVTVSDRAVRLWAYLAQYADRSAASPPLPALARDLGCSRASISRALAELAAAGWVTRESFRDDSGRHQTRTIIHGRPEVDA